MTKKIFAISPFVLLIALLSIIGCKNFNPKKDVLVFENVSVPFENLDPKRKSFEELDKIFQITCSKAKADCAHPLTFKPTSAVFNREGDETTVTLQYQASNSYGVPGEVVGECKFKFNNFIEFSCREK
jgi:hypothetical protein